LEGVREEKSLTEFLGRILVEEWIFLVSILEGDLVP
jgi:hypothetical protein